MLLDSHEINVDMPPNTGGGSSNGGDVVPGITVLTPEDPQGGISIPDRLTPGSEEINQSNPASIKSSKLKNP